MTARHWRWVGNVAVTVMGLLALLAFLLPLWAHFALGME